MYKLFSKIVGLCFPSLVLLLIGCASMGNVKYSQELANCDFLAEHSDYFLKAYEGTKKDEAYWGYFSIITASMLNIQYDSIITALESDTTNNFLQHIPNIKNILTQHLSCYSEIWSDAISRHVSHEYYSVDFSTALAICKIEFKRMGTFDRVINIKNQLKMKTSKFDNAKYPRTYEVYGLITQITSLTEEPT